MASSTYDSLTHDLAAGNVILGSDALYAMLVTGYTPNKATHKRRSDITAFEVTGTGYTAGGQALAGVAVTEDDANHWTLATATNPAWSGATISAQGAIVYKHRGGAAAADELVSYVDFGGTVTATGAPFTITSFASNGFVKIAD